MWRIIEQLLSPGCFCVFLLLLATVVRKRPWIRWFCVSSTLLVLLVSGNEWIARWAAAYLERQFTLPSPVPSADAIVVLGADAVRSKAWPRRIVETTAAGDRAVLAFEIFRQGKAPLILCTGGGTELGGRGLSEAEEARTLLASFGVPEQAILVETNSVTTLESAMNSRPLLEPKHAHRIVLVTTAMHLPTALGLFRSQYPSVEFIPAPTAYLFPDKPSSRWQEILGGCFPSADHLLMSEQIIHEYIKLLYRRARGQLVSG